MTAAAPIRPPRASAMPRRVASQATTATTTHPGGSAPLVAFRFGDSSAYVVAIKRTAVPATAVTTHVKDRPRIMARCGVLPIRSSN